jgi:hypothetical protein
VQIQWENKIGMASVIGAGGILIQAVVVIWATASIYTGITNKIEHQGEKIDLIEKGSDKRFEVIRDGIKTAQAHEAVIDNRLTVMETTVGFIKDSVQKIESKIKQ